MNSHSSDARRLARADALYGGIGMATTILELALIATNERFGVHALELSFIAQLLLSIAVETSSGAIGLRFGPLRTTLFGMTAKLLSAVCLAAAFVSSVLLGVGAAWFFLLLFLFMDAIGSGCLQTAFRPAYDAVVHHYSAGARRADFLATFARGLGLRIALPFAILTIAVAVHSFDMGTPGGDIYAAGIVLTIMSMLRIWQLAVSAADFRPLLKQGLRSSPANADVASRSPDREVAVVGTGARQPLARVRGWVSVAGSNIHAVLLFVFGNTAFLIVLMYIVGLLYRELESATGTPGLAWLGGTLVSFIIYVTASLLGRILYPRLSGHERKRSVLLGAIGLVGGTALACWAGMWLPESWRLATLIAFALVGVCAGGAMQRLATNLLIETAPAEQHSFLFIVAEASTNLLIVLCVALALLVAPDGAAVVQGLALLLVVGTVLLVPVVLMIARARPTGAQSSAAASSSMDGNRPS